MAPVQHPQPTRLSLRPVADPSRPQQSLPVGAWWPESRSLSDQLASLFALWPPESGRISRVLFSPPDWDDHPRSVDVGGRRVKTGSFPRDDTHELTLAMSNGDRHTITVIAPATTADDAAAQLATMSAA